MCLIFLAKLLVKCQGADAVGGLNLDDWIDPREQRKQDRFIQLGLVAACQAIEDSDWKPQDRESQNRTGVMIGSGIGGLESIVKT
jgi:3-oxoacyl-[acyl-carrier-protein] synthase II